MSRRNKKATVLALGMVITLLLSSCGSDKQVEEVTEVPENSVETVTEEAGENIEGAEAAEKTEETVEAEKVEEDVNNTQSCVGIWKYDEHDVWLAVNEDLTWTSYDGLGNVTYTGKFEANEVGYAMYPDGESEVNQYSFSDDGKFMDEDGNTLSRVEKLDFASTSDDSLTEIANFPGKFEAFTINYPSNMSATPRTDLANSLNFARKNIAKGSDDYFSNIMVTFQPLVDVDKYMGKGAGLAKPCMGYLLNNCMQSLYGDYIIKSLGTDFQDMGNFYCITGYMWMDGSIYPEVADQQIMGVMQMRYFGPTGYALIAVTISPVDTVENYFGLCLNMLDTCTYKTDWSTTPKTVPSTAGSNRGKSKKATAKPKKNVTTGSDSGDYGTAFYWTDEDGDIWYWNGYENIFQSFGTDGYIDDDGEFYESNDAGWDTDNYVDDYEIYSDPGDGNDAWSDPGDTEDYELYSDPGDGDDAWSDPGDTYDYEESYDYEDSYDYGDYGDDDY